MVFERLGLERASQGCTPDQILQVLLQLLEAKHRRANCANFTDFGPGSPSEPPLKTSVYAKVVQLADLGQRTGRAPRRLRSKSTWRIVFRPSLNQSTAWTCPKTLVGRRWTAKERTEAQPSCDCPFCRDLAPLPPSRNNLVPNVLTVHLYILYFTFSFLFLLQ